MLAVAIAACENKKAEEISILELDPADSGLTDFFLIASASNERQAQAIADEIELQLKREFHVYPNSVEGRRRGEWVLLDYVDFVVHIFLAEKRAYYGIERLRKSARPVGSQDLKVRPAKKSRAKKTAAKTEKKKASPRKTAVKAPAKRRPRKAAAP